ncbi:uncharacterized protein [Diadema antillarum]|uniref:uncharacterized protein n=1 Tax=Diadema antillarum TaxID=105358 RepID=UPI003A87F786
MDPGGTMVEPPVRRLPPLQVLHGTPALDLDTPPPSPGTPQGEMLPTAPVPTPKSQVQGSQSSLPQFSKEEISHCVQILEECFELLKPQNRPCLRTRGRVSSAFIHNKYSVAIAHHYSDLHSLLVRRAQLQLFRDCMYRASQMRELVLNLQELVLAEQNTLKSLEACECADPTTKLEYLPSLCEELRTQLSDWASIQHQLHSDKWLQLLLPQLRLDLVNMSKTLYYWRDCVLCWLHRLIYTGIRVLAFNHASSMSQELLFNVGRGIEEFNRLLARPSVLFERFTLPRTSLSSVSREAGFMDSPGLIHSCSPYTCSRLLTILAKERSRPVAIRTLHFLTANSKYLTAIKSPGFLFDWQAYYSSLTESLRDDIGGEVTSVTLQSSSSVISAMWDLKDSKALDLSGRTSPLSHVEMYEEEFIVKLLGALATSTNLLQRQVKTSKSSGIMSDLSRKSKTSALSSGGGGLKSRDPSQRKSVRWGDSLTQGTRQQLCGLYFEQLWQEFGTNLGSALQQILWKKYGSDQGEEVVGHVSQVDDLAAMTLVWVMEATCTKEQKNRLSQGALRALQSLATSLQLTTVLAAWDRGMCEVLASMRTDKCLLSHLGPGQMESKTCLLFQQCIIPLLSFLKAIEQHSGPVGPGHPKGKNGLNLLAHGAQSQVSHCQAGVVQALTRLADSLGTAAQWCQLKSQDFLTNGVVGPFLLICYGDLRVVSDHAMSALKLLPTLRSGLTTTQGPVSPRRQQPQIAIATFHANMEALQLRLNGELSRLQGLSSHCSRQFCKDCLRISDEFWPKSMPMGKVWRKKTTDELPSVHNSYAANIVDILLMPIAEGVTKLKTTAQITIMSIAVKTMLESWMSFILKEKPKFSVHGAHQLEQDFGYVHQWLSSSASKLGPESKQSVLSLDAIRNFEGAILLLKQQPMRKSAMANASSKDEINSEYSTSTAQSTESRRGSFGSMSDSPLTTQNLNPLPHPQQQAPLSHPTTLPLGGDYSTQTTGSDRGYATDSADGGAEEETYNIPHRKEWLSLRVHTGNRWKSPFSCLNSPAGMES